MCDICSDARRQTDVVCVVEQPRDVTALEASGVFQGLYHVLQGKLSPLDGIGPEKLTIDALVRRVNRDGVTELIMATNPTLEGDGTALFISNILAKTAGTDHPPGPRHRHRQRAGIRQQGNAGGRTPRPAGVLRVSDDGSERNRHDNGQSTSGVQ